MVWSIVCCAVLFLLAGCKSSGYLKGSADEATGYLSSKVALTVPTKEAALTVNGTLKLKSGECLQIAFLMPILRSEVARMEVTPDRILLVDRMGKRYVEATRDELKRYLPRKATFHRLEKMLYEAAKPGGKRALKGTELGIPGLEKAEVELHDFTTAPFRLTPTSVSAKYKRVELEELLGMLLSL